MTTFAEELEEASPSACFEAVEWVTLMMQLDEDRTENDLWKMCPRGDWLHWLLLDAFAVDDKGYFGEWYEPAARSLRVTLRYPAYLGDEHLEELADRIREIFPEWPL